MAGKLHPPYIDGKVPAFCSHKEIDGTRGTTLLVPFRHNRAVSASDYIRMSCKLTTVATNEWQFTVETTDIDIDENGIWYAEFDLAQEIPSQPGLSYADKLIKGLYYKIQIAYVAKKSGVGYYSDVGVTKYTSEPSVTIEGLSGGINIDTGEYIGIYSQKGGDISEKEYSYCFTIVDESGAIFDTTGTQIHNSATDTEQGVSYDTYECNKELALNKRYKLTYTVTTLNNLTRVSPTYIISRKNTVTPNIDAKLHATLDYENGCIHVYLQANEKDDKYGATGATGNYKITRACSKDNFLEWHEICNFSLNKEIPTRNLFNDFTIEQGVRYLYSIQQYNTRGLYSNKILSEVVQADFEDMFLYDGDRQLKVRFNPNVSSFKNDILETKTDTIGGKYPFIYRNGNVKYKEFPITGLISYLSDENEYFMPKSELGILSMEGTDLTGENIHAERQFKLTVLEWLTNGKPKLFRSPTEGNYFVRLMNSSLAPNAPTGRMLHTFTCTAYEIGGTDFKTLFNNGMFNVADLTKKIMNFQTYDITSHNRKPFIGDKSATNGLSGYYFKNNKFYNSDDEVIRLEDISVTELQNSACYIVNRMTYLGQIRDMAEGSIIGIRYSSSESASLEYVMIGATHNYNFDTKGRAPYRVYLIYTPNTSYKFDGSFTYGFYSLAASGSFDKVIDFDEEVDMQQFIGEYPANNDVIYNITSVLTDAGTRIKDPRVAVGVFYKIKILVRDIQQFYMQGNIPYWGETAVEITEGEIYPFSVYADISDPNDIKYYDGQDIYYHCTSQDRTSRAILNIADIYNNASYYWRMNPTLNNRNGYYRFSFNHTDYNVDLETIGRYEFTNLENITQFTLGKMLKAECLYQKTIITYSCEENATYFDYFQKIGESVNDTAHRITWMYAKENYFDALSQMVEFEKTAEITIDGTKYTGEAAVAKMGAMTQTAGSNYSNFINSPFYTLNESALTMDMYYPKYVADLNTYKDK